MASTKVLHLPEVTRRLLLSESADSHKELRRIEVFSDGVFAIACTLLILEFRVPHPGDISVPDALWPALKTIWPSFVGYVLSFGAILIAWAGHHRNFRLLIGSSKAFLYANGLLLLTITFIPFPTAVLAEYVTTPQANIAVMFYSAAFLAVSVGFNVCWLSVFRPIRLLSPHAGRAAVKRDTIQMLSGLPAYAGTTVISYWFPMIGLAIIFGMELLWIVMTMTVAPGE
ncbi:MAG TPA: TMEM175 family protein [bacterium]|nr:TMEM175 family protein [bacterium]